jgi:hypothetical protein
MPMKGKIDKLATQPTIKTMHQKTTFYEAWGVIHTVFCEIDKITVGSIRKGFSRFKTWPAFSLEKRS